MVVFDRESNRQGIFRKQYKFWITFIGQGEQGRWAKAPWCEVLWLTKLPLLMQISCTKSVFYNSKFSVFNLKLFDFDHLHCLLPTSCLWSKPIGFSPKVAYANTFLRTIGGFSFFSFNNQYIFILIPRCCWRRRRSSSLHPTLGTVVLWLLYFDRLHLKYLFGFWCPTWKLIWGGFEIWDITCMCF